MKVGGLKVETDLLRSLRSCREVCLSFLYQTYGYSSRPTFHMQRNTIYTYQSLLLQPSKGQKEDPGVQILRSSIVSVLMLTLKWNSYNNPKKTRISRLVDTEVQLHRWVTKFIKFFYLTLRIDHGNNFTFFLCIRVWELFTPPKRK